MQLPADATLNHAAGLAAALPQAVATGSGPWLVDASVLHDFDSSTLALLLQAQRLATAAGREIQIRGLPPQLMGLARLYGVDELLPLSDT
ncbi:MAG: STAS domain-containing protein, partial [Rubrivivax sp.]|nr:STAS domain-containing protein [Rubrivivax sp.]